MHRAEGLECKNEQCTPIGFKEFLIGTYAFAAEGRSGGL